MSSPKSRLINYKIKVNAGKTVCFQKPHQARLERQLYRESKLSFAARGEINVITSHDYKHPKRSLVCESIKTWVHHVSFAL